ncbi:sodium channel protein Nach-like [Diabrotica virgifera virgifera]|uniref:Sodium channel protein Nach-like n=1 Tax=Diabrotica virgifera virgifera TaxID=50390 RepID=A0ABM5ICY8_DIAVI|nr:sodium channel protein Nach-like [Diabrotica virgifera virgifera]
MAYRRNKNNSKKWKESFKTQGKLFFENSTLHGVKYVAESGRSFMERFMWFTWITIGIVTTTVIIVNLWEKFQTNPTITGLDTDFHNWDVAFPAITICQHIPTSEEKIREFIEVHQHKNETDIADLDFYTKVAQLSINTWSQFTQSYSQQSFVDVETDMKELVYNISNKCDDVFQTCYWKSTAYNCCDIFDFVFTEHGFCYTFNSKHYDKHFQKSADYEFKKKYIQETDLKWSLTFQVKSTASHFSIFIINSNEITGIDFKPQHIWDFRIDTILFSVKQTYTTEDTSQLNIKQRHCAFENEVKIQIDDTYSYTGCTTECRMNNAMKLCSCIPFFYTIVNKNYRHCRFDEISCINEHLEEIKSVDKCNCHLGCLHTVYEIEKLDTLMPDEEGEGNSKLENKFVSWPMVRYKREVLFGWVDLLVSFGGIAGLFLGFSLLSAVEILYYFSIRVYCTTRQKRKTASEDKFKKYNEKFLVPVPVYYNQRRLSDLVLSRMTNDNN